MSEENHPKLNLERCQHEWFVESKSSKQNPKRDWFIWRKGKEDENGQKLPPNNWKSVFGAGPAWTYDEGTDEWYLRLFVSQVGLLLRA